MALTYYGINVGTFVIQVEDNNYQSLSLSIDEERLELTDRLSCPSLDRCTDADFSYIPTDIDEGLGSKNSDKGYYFAYSFYLINSGKLALSYQMDYNLLYTSRNLEKILRVMLVVDGKTEVYAASQDSGDAEPIIVEKKDNIIGYTTAFASYTPPTIISHRNYDFGAGMARKYTCVMWLDGWDMDQRNEMMGGKLKTEITFTILK